MIDGPSLLCLVESSLYDFAKSGHSVTDRVNFINAPPCDNNMNMKDNIFVKEALFQFIANIDRKL